MGDKVKNGGGSTSDHSHSSHSSVDDGQKGPQAPIKPSDGPQTPKKPSRTQMPLIRMGTPERQGIRLKVKGSQGVNILQALGSCLTSCEATSAIGMTSQNDVEHGAYQPSVISGNDSNSSGSLPDKTSSMTLESPDGSNHGNNKSVVHHQPLLRNINNNLIRPQSMINLASNKKSDVVKATVTPAVQEVLSKSGSLDGLHQAALYTKTRSRRSRIVTPPMLSSRPRPFPKATPPDQKDTKTRAFREADGMEGGHSPFVGVAYSARLHPPGLGGGAWGKGQAAADWVQYLPRGITMPPQVREEGEEDLERKRPVSKSNNVIISIHLRSSIGLSDNIFPIYRVTTNISYNLMPL